MPPATYHPNQITVQTRHIEIEPSAVYASIYLNSVYPAGAHNMSCLNPKAVSIWCNIRLVSAISSYLYHKNPLMTLPDNRAAARYRKKNSILNQQLSCNNIWWKFTVPDHRWVLSRRELFLWWPLTTTKPPSIHLPGPSNSSGTTLTYKRIWEWKITQQGVSVKRGNTNQLR